MGKTVRIQKKLTFQQVLFITTIALGTLLNPLNSSMIAVALSRMQQDFHLTFTTASWLISTYYLASAVGQPVMGKLSDRFGRKRLFLLGLIMIAVASLLAPFSPGFGWLIGFRIIQALGSSVLFPAGMGMIRQSITENQAYALGILSIFSSTSAAFGPSIGGFLIHFGDWPAIFLVNFPFIILSFILALSVLPKDRVALAKKVKLDVWGIILFTSMIVSWLFFLLSLEKRANVWELVLAGIVTAGFYRYEFLQQSPFIDVQSLRKNPNVTLVYVQFILVNTIFYSIFFGVPAYLQNVVHDDAKQTGIIMLSIAGFGAVIAPLVGRWIDRKGSKPALVLRALVIIMGTSLLWTIQQHSPSAWIFGVLSVLGISNGINNLGMQTALYSFVPPEETGTASGLFMTSRYIGTILSSSLLGIIFGKTITTAHFHAIAAVSGVIGVLILLLSIRMPNVKSMPKHAANR